jgi:hypothetical protein
MATEVFETQTITLSSGKKLELKPLKIKILREFMKAFEDLPAAMNDNVASIDVIMKCVAVAMKQYDSELSENMDLMEDEFDLPTAYKVIEIGSGIKLGDDDDPNPQVAAQDGKN